MKISRSLPCLTAAACLACAIGSLVAVQPENEQSPQRRTIFHAGEELEVTEYPDGTTGISLVGLPLHYSVSRVASDGSVEMECVKAKAEELSSFAHPSQPQAPITR